MGVGIFGDFCIRASGSSTLSPDQSRLIDPISLIAGWNILFSLGLLDVVHDLVVARQVTAFMEFIMCFPLFYTTRKHHLKSTFSIFATLCGAIGFVIGIQLYS